GSEEEQFVFLDGAANREPKRICNLYGLSGPAKKCETRINGSEGGRLNDVPTRTVPVIRAAFEDLVGNCATTPAEFRAGGVQNHSHFTNSFVVDGLYRLAGNLSVVVVLAVEKEIVAAGTSAIGRKADPIAG